MIQASRRFILHLHVSILQLNVLISTISQVSTHAITIWYLSFILFFFHVLSYYYYYYYYSLRSLCGGIFLKLAHVMTYMTTSFFLKDQLIITSISNVRKMIYLYKRNKIGKVDSWLIRIEVYGRIWGFL